MEIILHPDATEPTLREPNSGLVVRVNTPGTLQVQVQPMRPGGSRAAMVRIEPIQSGRMSVTSARPKREHEIAHANVATEGLTLLGHVAGRGDVIVGPNAWIAGPTAPSRVEGVALEWPEKPAGVDIRYAVQFANGQAGSGRMVPLGTYAGTRGRALPITGVVLEMNGTDELEFVAEAEFLNAPTLRAVGKRVVLSGPTNREPLVGHSHRHRADRSRGTACELPQGRAKACRFGPGPGLSQPVAPGERRSDKCDPENETSERGQRPQFVGTPSNRFSARSRPCSLSDLAHISRSNAWPHRR